MDASSVYILASMWRPYDPASWARLPLPTRGDEDMNSLAAAMGRAICLWEEIEVQLSFLYGRFLEIPISPEREYQLYGEPLNFKDRATQLERLAASYFVKYPNQNKEAEFSDLIITVRNFAVRRNEIAHSIIDLMNRMIADSGYALFPPAYTKRKWDERHAPTYAYTTNELEYYIYQFRILWRIASAMQLSFETRGSSRRKHP